MRREEARKAAEVMLAYADGKEIEFKTNGTGKWLEANEPSFDWQNNAYRFRVKPKPQYRPYYNLQECFKDMKNHEPFGYLRQKQKGDLELVMGTWDDEYEFLRLSVSGLCKLNTAFERYTYFDGQPFGVKYMD